MLFSCYDVRMRYALKRIQILLFGLLLCAPWFLAPTQVHAVTGQVYVSATVAPVITSFSLSLTSSAPGTLPQDASIPVNISYSSDMTTSSPLAIQASWDKGTI